MSKFTFICQEEAMPFSDVVSSKRTVEFNADSLDQIVEEFEHFLRGCGFYFNGHLNFVKDDCESDEQPEWHTEEFKTHLNRFDESEQLSLCPVCKIDTNSMRNIDCYDKNCPKVN